MVLDNIDQTRQEFQLRLLGYVIMLDHVHLVVIPPVEAELGRIIGDLKRTSARDILDFLRTNDSALLEELMVVRDGRLKSVLWQKRCFDHNCRNDDAVKSRIEYCHSNPVKRGLVQNAEDWPWSSCRWYLGIKDVKLRIDVDET